MKHLKKLLMVAALLSSLILISCDNTTEAVEKNVKYDLIINNHTQNVYDVYMTQDLTNDGFSKVGIIYATNHFHYHDLVIDVNYTFRLVASGGSVDNPAHEKNVRSTNSTNVFWDVN